MQLVHKKSRKTEGKRSNRILVMFPEVNILTAELGIVQKETAPVYSTLVHKVLQCAIPSV